MSELKNHKIIFEEKITRKHDGYSSQETDPLAVAFNYWFHYYEYEWYIDTRPELLTMTVDGHTFTLEEIKAYGRDSGQLRYT